MLNKIIKYFLENKLVTVLLLLVFIGWGIVTSPFDWNVAFLPKDPVPVDAIPDLGENQQIVFTEWPGRSPQDIEDQITYPLTTSLLGIPNVKSIRSSSMFGVSSIYIIFEEKVDFYWSRSRVLEKLNSLSTNLLPDGVNPSLGPDATALGQVYWYTIEGRDPEGNVTGGWDLPELRSVQDYYVKYALNGVSGVSEVASVGGYVREYQVDVNPDALKAYNIGIDMVMMAVKNSNRDIGAKTIEINKAEYFIRGLGYIKSTKDLENTVVLVTNTGLTQHFAAANQLFQYAVCKVGVDCRSTKAQQTGDLVGVARTGGFQHDIGFGAQSLLNKMMVHRACGEHAVHRQSTFLNTPI